MDSFMIQFRMLHKAIKCINQILLELKGLFVWKENI